MVNKKLLIIVGIIIIILFFIIRVCFIYTADFDAYCNMKYGEDYFYDSADDYNYNIRKCVNIDEEGNINEKFITIDKYDSLCIYPSFWDLKKWFSYCELEEAQER